MPISTEIKDAEKAGLITAKEADDLEKTYSPQSPPPLPTPKPTSPPPPASSTQK